MAENIEVEAAEVGIQLIDDAYLAWFGAESECETKLRDWFGATGEQREPAYRAYLAALDREEASARDMERLWGLASAAHHARVDPRERVSE